jgi:hypothetical protein
MVRTSNGGTFGTRTGNARRSVRPALRDRDLWSRIPSYYTNLRQHLLPVFGLAFLYSTLSLLTVYWVDNSGRLHVGQR